MTNSNTSNIETRGFKGIWIPARVWLSTNLSILEKCLIAEISSLDSGEGCFKSNESFGEFLGVGERQVSRMISHLIDLGFVRIANFDGRKRWLKVCIDIYVEADTTPEAKVDINVMADTTKMSTLGSQKCLHSNKDEINNERKKENIKKKESLDLSFGEEASLKAEIKSEAKSELDEQAETIYKAYPRKKARPDAIKAIKKALKVVGYTTLYGKVQKYAEAVKESQIEPSYIPYPATWFNREEYNDDWNDLYQRKCRNNQKRIKASEQHYDRTPFLNPDDPDDIPF